MLCTNRGIPPCPLTRHSPSTTNNKTKIDLTLFISVEDKHYIILNVEQQSPLLLEKLVF